MWGIQCCTILSLAAAATGLYCYNCSETQQETNQCAGIFGTGAVWFNSSRLRLTNCTGDNAMCFVRSWSMRSKHSWLVQRGCYKSSLDDPLPRTVRHPTRSMSCKRERYKDAEYKVCLCQADWCNSAQSSEAHRWRHLAGVVGIFTSILSLMPMTMPGVSIVTHGHSTYLTNRFFGTYIFGHEGAKPYFIAFGENQNIGTLQVPITADLIGSGYWAYSIRDTAPGTLD